MTPKHPGKKPPEKAFVLVAWGLAVALFAVLSGTAFLQSKAADPARSDLMTVQETCQSSCERDQAMCRESTGPRLENYGESQSTVGLDAACDSSLRECLHKCGTVSPLKQQPKSEPDIHGRF